MMETERMEMGVIDTVRTSSLKYRKPQNSLQSPLLDCRVLWLCSFVLSLELLDSLRPAGLRSLEEN